jgi:hypothetical protein
VKQLLLVAAAVAVAVLLSQLLFDFYQWNREQSCASSGGRNCGGAPIPMQR